MSACCAAAIALSCTSAKDLNFFSAGVGSDDQGTGGVALAATGGGAGDSGVSSGGTNAERDARAWPFSSESFWNMPLGSAAIYRSAGVIPATGRPMTAVVSIVILRSEAPLTQVFFSSAAWSGADRCPAEGELLFEVPIPDDYLLPDDRETNSLAALMPDGRTLVQAQPFARCEPGGIGTALVRYPDSDLYGEGREGATGGSGLSSLGGTLRVGEFRPNSGPIRHALKISIDAANLMDCDIAADCFRWPAVRADEGATGDYSGTNAELKMGSLLALAPDLDIDSLNLESSPGRRLAEAFQDYGGYVANQTGASVYGLGVEKGPDGDFMSQFEADWGMPFEDNAGTPWTNDVLKIFAELSVVTNNMETQVGGGGAPRAPLAPDLNAP